MRTTFYFLCSVLALLYSCHIQAQSYTYTIQSFGVEEGLMHRNVQQVFKDQDGFIWLATDSGLQRYDGYEFKFYPLVGPKGKVSHFHYIGQDDDGWIWLCVDSQHKNYHTDFYFLNPVTGEILDVEQRLGITLAAELRPLLNTIEYTFYTKNKNGQLFFGGKDHLALFDFKKGVTNIDVPVSKPKPIDIDLIDEQNNFWIFSRTSDSYLKKISPTGLLLDSFELSSYNAKIYGVNNVYEWGNDIYIAKLENTDVNGAQDHFFKIDTVGTFQPVFTAPVGYDFFEFVNGQLWYIGESGWSVFDLNGNPILKLNKADYDAALFEYLHYKDIKTDESGKLYLGTGFGFNIISLRKSPFTPYFSNNKQTTIPFKNQARGVYVENDSIFINFEHSSLVYAEKNNPDNYQIIADKVWSLNPESDITPYDGRVAIRDEKGSFWTNHAGRITKWTPDFSTQEQFLFSKDFAIWNEQSWTIYMDKDGCIWNPHSSAIGLRCKGEATLTDFRYDEAGFGREALNIYQIQEDNDEQLWLCSENGLYVFDKKTHKVVEHYHQTGQDQYAFPENEIFMMHIDSTGNRWIGTRSGLVFWDIKTGEKRLFDRNDGLSNNVIYAVLEDDYNRLWLSSDFGIMSFDKETYQVQTYLTRDGITHEEFNRVSYFQEADGTIYFGGLNGVTAFHPEDFLARTKNYPKVLISDYEIFDGKAGKVLNKTSELVESQTITFHPNDRFFKIKFTLPTFDGLGRTLYAWKIDGVYEDWTYQKENSIQIGVLPYGNHTLRIKGQTGDGGWSPHELAVSVAILKPFYLKIGFILATIFMLITLVVLFFKARTSYLEKEIAKATITIAQQTEELKALDKLKSRFFANVSHELRTPLTLMLGPIRRLMKESQKDNGSHKMLGFLERSTIHLKELVNEILDLSKLESNKIEIQEEPIRFYDFISNHLNQFYSIGSSENVNVRAHLSIDKNLNILLDQGKFKKVINNFISNAIKFSRKKGEIIVSLEEQKDEILLKVTDEGRGIHPDDLPFVFDRFFQSKALDSPADGGTGIGLSMCRELAELMNGNVWAESSLGRGSVFYFSFPKKIAAVSAVPSVGEEPILEGSNSLVQEEPRATSEAVKGKKILIVEDNRDLREYYKIILNDYQLITTEHGQEALDYLQQNEAPDLIISDLMMPVMDGMQFVSILKSSDQWWHIPVIMLTAKTNQEIKIKVLRYGIDDYLNKPFDDEELRVRIHNLLQHQRDRKSFVGQGANEESAIQLSKQDQAWLEEVENYVLDNISSEFLTVSNISRAFTMSESTFLRQLKRLTGLTPAKYIQELKLNHAKALIQNKEYKTILQVAHLIGYKSAAAFSRTFKKRFGTTPVDLV